MLPGWVEEKEKSAEEALVTLGGLLVMVVSGGAVSTVQENPAGVGSTLPAGSVARTWKEWVPSARPE